MAKVKSFGIILKQGPNLDDEFDLPNSCSIFTINAIKCKE